ncbi:keratin, type II cytoskeletal 2 epidermal-like [Osmerus eperlanus]|uniref:keratin, type II cytoskeletal 2 epidermal-like n=1 Tax=Osmerus eperlanus TaxID=29151 RepID=UPI002E1445DB
MYCNVINSRPWIKETLFSIGLNKRLDGAGWAQETVETPCTTQEAAARTPFGRGGTVAPGSADIEAPGSADTEAPGSADTEAPGSVDEGALGSADTGAGDGGGQKSSGGVGSGQKSSGGVGSGQKSSGGVGSGQKSSGGVGSGQKSSGGEGGGQKSRQGQPQSSAYWAAALEQDRTEAGAQDRTGSGHRTGLCLGTGGRQPRLPGRNSLGGLGAGRLNLGWSASDFPEVIARTRISNHSPSSRKSQDAWQERSSQERNRSGSRAKPESVEEAGSRAKPETVEEAGSRAKPESVEEAGSRAKLESVEEAGSRAEPGADGGGW